MSGTVAVLYKFGHHESAYFRGERHMILWINVSCSYPEYICSEIDNILGVQCDSFKIPRGTTYSFIVVDT